MRFCALILIAAISAQASTVVIPPLDFGSGPSKQPVTITNLSNPTLLSNGVYTVAFKRIENPTNVYDGRSNCAVVTLHSGSYKALIGQYSIAFNVPDDTNTYWISQLATNGSTVGSLASVWLRTNSLVAGSNVFLQYYSTGVVINVTGGGGGSGTAGTNWTVINTNLPAGMTQTNGTTLFIGTNNPAAGFSLTTNSAWGAFTNFNVFTNTTGNPNYIRGTYVYAGVTGGANFWTNGVAAVYSNGVTVGGNGPYWCYATNNGIPGTTTNFVWYYATNVDALGYPQTYAWVKLAGGGGSPQIGLRFLITNTQTANPFAHLLSRYEILTPAMSNSTVARVEKFGSDSDGRIGFVPFATPYGALNNPTNTATDLIIGPGWWTNDYGVGSGMTLPSGMRVSGSGQGVTMLSAPNDYTRGNQFYGPFLINSSNTIRDLTIYGVLSPTNLSSQSISNLLIEDCTLGSPTNVDCIFASAVAPGGIYNAVLNRVTMYSCWDTVTGIATGEYNDCITYLDGALQPAQSIGNGTNGVHGIYCGISGAASSYTIRGGRVVVRSITPPGMLTGNVSTNSCLYVVDTNAVITILGTEFYYPTGCVAVYSANVANTNPLNINGYFYQNGTLVTVTNGVFTTNGAPVALSSLPSAVVTNGASGLTLAGGWTGGVTLPSGAGLTNATGAEIIKSDGTIKWRISNVNFLTQDDPENSTDYAQLAYPDNGLLATNGALFGVRGIFTNVFGQSLNLNSNLNLTGIFSGTVTNTATATNSGAAANSGAISDYAAHTFYGAANFSGTNTFTTDIVFSGSRKIYSSNAVTQIGNGAGLVRFNDFNNGASVESNGTNVLVPGIFRSGAGIVASNAATFLGSISVANSLTNGVITWLGQTNGAAATVTNQGFLLFISGGVTNAIPYGRWAP